jgi:hypothetical protein
LAPEVSPQLVNGVDRQWSQLTRYYMDSYIQRTPSASDITAPHAYMVGHYADQPGQAPRVILADLGKWAPNLYQSRNIEQYEQTVFDIADSAIGIEQQLGSERSLQLTRATIEQALALSAQPEFEPNRYARAVQRATRHMLETSVIFDIYEEKHLDRFLAQEDE